MPKSEIIMPLSIREGEKCVIGITKMYYCIHKRDFGAFILFFGNLKRKKSTPFRH